MKLFKKLALLCTLLLMSFSLCLGIASCDDDVDSSQDSSSQSASSDSGSSDEDEPSDYVYRIKVANAGGYGFKGVTVSLYNGETEIASKTTSSSGYATFTEEDLTVGAYQIRVTDLPKGYQLDGSNLSSTIAAVGFETIMQINPTGLLAKEDMPANTSYSLGKVMYDFTATTSDGSKFTLSEVLEEKELVMINFWATWCGPCKSEFPAMNNAYLAYKDDVAILAISTTDSMSAVRDFKSEQSLDFDMTSDSECGAGISLKNMFGVSGIPHTIMVDRYGVVVFNHVGSMTAMSDFTSRFDRFLGDDYSPTVIVGSGENMDTETEIELMKPNVDAPSVADLHTALGTTADEFTYRWQPTDEEKHDEYSWPWVLSAEKEYITTPITNIHGGYAQLYMDFEAEPGDVLYLDYYVSSETASDVLYFLIDGVIVHQLSGTNQKDWTENFVAYVFKEGYDAAGKHELVLIYSKDTETSAGDDVAKVKNLHLVKDADLTNVNGRIFRQAASILNTDENATTRYKNYVPAVLGEDGYYHAKTADGPILFANMMFASQWSEISLWLLAYYDFVICDGYNFHSEIEDFAWEANNNLDPLTYGYTPVTEDLKQLLDYATSIKSYDTGMATQGSDSTADYKYWQGETHSNEWLELCVYYETYGDAAPMEDPMKTISFHAAKEVYASHLPDAPNEEVKNTADVLFEMTPRGFKHKFIPTVSGVYNVYSVGSSSTICFLVAEDKQTFLGTFEENIGATRYDETSKKEVADGNFNYYYYFEEGKTYYLLLTTFLDTPGEYDFYIDYVGEEHTYLTNCAKGLYSMNMATSVIYIPDAVDYAYNEQDGLYHVVNADGSMGSVIYLDLNRPTAFFGNNSLYSIANAALAEKDGKPVYAPEKRAFYINGVDYSETIADLGYEALQNEGELKGFMAVDQELFEIINTITQSEKYEGLEESWLMLCYYYKMIGTN